VGGDIVVQSSEFRVQSSEFRVQSSEFRGEKGIGEELSSMNSEDDHGH
jgi:hypothetical protein